MHRLHESLPSGVTRGTIWPATYWRSKDWEVVRLPAIAEEDGRHLTDTLAGPPVFTRRQGEALHGGREPLSMLVQMRKTTGE